ncbi:MAG: ferrous iron transport protein A [Spirochaetales bacterium]|nr:ferrous iron transport protein A [Spirochaetales bacterium]MCP5485874.1 ferrous iron transport protein A [Spirochaetales bacterium]
MLREREGPLNLAALRPGTRARIVALDPARADLTRLLEMGLIPGQEIEFLRAAPLGDPLQVRVMGYELALRRCDARSISVEPVNEGAAHV